MGGRWLGSVFPARERLLRAGPGEPGGDAGGRPQEGGGRLGRSAGGFIVSFALLLPRLAPGVTGKQPEPPGGGLFIERAARASRSPAGLTGPLTRLAAGPSPRDCALGSLDNGLLCVQLPPPLGVGEGGWWPLPDTPPSRLRPPER